MAYTNSSMVVYKKLSPNHSGQRTHSIDRITPHCVVGQCTAEGLGEWFEKKSTQASSNYGIDRDGRVALYVEEKNRSWCTSSNANDQRAITIECASDTTEPYAFRDGSYETITADFRKYPCIEDSIADHSAYLLGAKNGSKLRYDGLKGCTDYKKAVQIIKGGGYATSLTYVEKLCSIIEKWNLTQYDAKDSGGGEVIRWYRVRKSWADSKTQKGAFKILDNAKKCADQNPRYKVFDVDGNVVYEPKAAEPAEKVPFLVKVSISDLNIRCGPGTDYARVQFIPIGVYTIVEVKSGKGASAWGRLKSGIGWISLDHVKRV